MRVDYAHDKCQGNAVGNIIFNQAAPKKSANLSINADLLRQAKQLNINLSQTLEQHLAEIIRQAQRKLWLAENQSALDEYNRRIESRGTFSDGLRRF
jgi:antitoxin CcdA